MLRLICRHAVGDRIGREHAAFALAGGEVIIPVVFPQPVALARGFVEVVRDVWHPRAI